MKHKILIIDDSIVNINALYIMLKDKYQVYVAKNGKDGIKQAKSMEISLILLDVLMPEMDGFEVLDILMKDQKTRGIPVMFITSLNDDKDEEKGLTLGAVDYITKPFNPSVIKAKVRNHIELFEYRKTIENIAMLDGLTGVPNRRSYNEKMQEYWERAKQEKRPLSVAIVDIDCFKEYNDNYGHLKGDMVLKKVAEELKRSLPAKDGFVARYGGEEFVVILYGYEKQDALLYMEQMRKNVESLQIEHLHSRAGKVLTISVGGNTVIPSTSEIKQFIEIVDNRLYRAKSMGRNLLIWEDQKETKGQVEVFLFGHLKLLSQEGMFVATKAKKNKVWLLLAYLIVNRYKDYTKEELVHAIWPYEEVEDEEFELRILLDEIRGELSCLKLAYLQELIITVNGVYRWNNSYMCIADFELFENIYNEVVREEDKRRRYELCDRAVELYKEEFLYKLTDVKWVSDQRKLFRKEYQIVLAIFVKLLYEMGEYKKIVRISQREIYSNELEEELHYYYLLALIQLHRNKEALEHFEYVVEIYYSTLKKTPPDRITGLYMDILQASKEKRLAMAEVTSLMKEEDKAAGAYYCDLHVFKNIYQLEARNMIRSGKIVYFAILNLELKGYAMEKEQDECEAILYNCIKDSLRLGDVFCKISVLQFGVLFPSTNYETAKRVMDRIGTSYNEHKRSKVCTFSYELVPLIKAEVITKDLKK